MSLKRTALACLWVLSGCDDSEAPAPSTPRMSAAELRDPGACKKCHPTHHEQWSMSMHAYAAEDPIFLAMNRRAQRETQGAIGDLCIRCHAPVAVLDGLTRDGLNLDQVPRHLLGVTCFSCHAVERVDALHNNGLVLSTTGTLRSGIPGERAPMPHGGGYSALHARDSIKSSTLCGSCHDVRLHSGLEAARTMAEWQASLFGRDIEGQRLTCGNCHMPAATGKASSEPGSPVREIHDHAMPGVDVAITDFPGRALMRALVQENLDPSLSARLCVKPPQGEANVEVTLDNAFVGHSFPSGATYDRRAWVELVAYEGDQVIYQSGVVPDGVSVESKSDPDLWLLGSKLRKAGGEEAHFLWESASIQSQLLSAAVTRDPADPAYYHAVTRGYFVPFSADRVTMRVRITPVPLEVIDDLISTGDLDPSLRAQIPTFTLGGTVREWSLASGYGCVP